MWILAAFYALESRKQGQNSRREKYVDKTGLSTIRKKVVIKGLNRPPTYLLKARVQLGFRSKKERILG
jgi:hypothetical protein